MNELQKKTLAALTKQVELLTKDGECPASVLSAKESIDVLTRLLAVLL